MLAQNVNATKNKRKPPAGLDTHMLNNRTAAAAGVGKRGAETKVDIIWLFCRCTFHGSSMAAAWTDLAQYASECTPSLVPHAQATNSVMQRAGINRSFTGMGSRAGSTGKLPMSRTASGSVLDRQEVDAGDHL